MLDDPSNQQHEKLDNLPIGSIKEQLEGLITHMGFEAHKAEAVLDENSDTEQKQIDAHYESMQ